MDENEWRKTLNNWLNSEQQTIRDEENRLDKLLSETDAVQLFVAALFTLSAVPAQDYSEIEYGSVSAMVESLAFYLYPRFSADGQTAVTPWRVRECIEIIDALFNARIRSLSLASSLSDDPAALLIHAARINAEVVRGSAYPEQTTREIVEIQGRFEAWFASKVGIGPNRAQQILWAVKDRIQSNFNGLLPDLASAGDAYQLEWNTAHKKRKRQRSERQDFLTSAFADAQSARAFGFYEALTKHAMLSLPISPEQLTLEEAVSPAEWEALLLLLGMSSDRRAEMAEPIEVQSFPLYLLPDGRVVMQDISNALDVLWECFERVSRSDVRLFERYQTHKSKWLEDKTIERLEKVFPKHQVYRSLSYSDPDMGNDSVAELDAAVKWGSFLLLFEAKSRQFRLEAQLGDVGRLRTDLKANVQDAFEQAMRAVRYIGEAEKAIFTEANTGRKLIVEAEKTEKIFLVTVTLHELAGLATELATLNDIGLFTTGEYPIAISIADITTITEFSEGPDVMVHYFERRVALQHDSLRIVADELDLFGAYLQTRLQAGSIWANRNIEFDIVNLSGFSDVFDAWSFYERGEIEDAPDIRLQVPPELREILEHLRGRNDDSARRISFSLLDLSELSLASIAKAVRDLRQAQGAPGTLRSTVHQEANIVVVILSGYAVPLDVLERAVEHRALIEKYRRKAAKCIGLGFDNQVTTEPMSVALLLEYDWGADPDLDELIAEEPGFRPVSGQKLPKRNSLCPCGSGLKFKTCCLPRLRSAPRSGPMDGN